jgi:hypothetical protein
MPPDALETIPSAATAATEISPLLGGEDISRAAEPSVPNGTHGEIERTARNGDAGVSRGGMPEVAAKMHLLLPAIGIGIYLCAVDQLLTVATYAKIGNDLNALNNISWIATA